MRAFLAMKKFFIDVDTFLIDRVFQPISDKMARYVSCYGIAAFLLTGAIPVNFVLGWMDNSWWLTVLAAIWMPALVYRAYRLEASALAAAQPPDRVAYRDLRSLGFFAQFLTSPYDFIYLFNGNRLMFIESVSWWLIVFALYFMACRRNPPKPQTVLITA